MSAGRFVIEGTWLGYRSGQDRIVHRTVHKASEKGIRAWAEKTHSITYTDGTRLLIDVRDCKPRERVEEKRGYARLICDCVFYDASTVQEVIDAQQAAKAARSAA